MVSKPDEARAIRLLILNPNSSKEMTKSMERWGGLLHNQTPSNVDFYTAPPASPTSINTAEDLDTSTRVVLQDSSSWCTEEGRSVYDGILIACFSAHPLVPQLQTLLPRTVVTGILEASVLTALSLLKPDEKWGVVTTGPFWEKHLSDGAVSFLGADNAATNSKFAGVQPTGLNASDFHQGVGADVVKRKIREATWKLLSKGNVACILMGCAGMAGLDLEIRKAAEEARGHDFAFKLLHVVDGVVAGMVQIEQMVRQMRLSSFSDAAAGP